MQFIDSLYTLFEPIVEPMGYGIVRVQLSGDKRRVLQVMIERLDDQAITVDDCAQVSRALSVHLDVEDVIKGQYTLEISSPGLERPLVKIKDYKRFLEKEVMVQTIMPVENRKNFQGFLEKATDEQISVRLKHPLDNGADEINIRYSDIRQAHLVSSI